MTTRTFDLLTPHAILDAVESAWGLRPDGTLSAYHSYVNRVFAVGTDGLIINGIPDRWGTDWTVQASGTIFSLFAITGDHHGGIFAAGYSGVVLHFDGADWTLVDTGRYDRLNALDADPCGTIHTAGLWGLILRYDP